MANIARLRQAVDESGMKRRELAEALGVSEAQVSRLLSGRRAMKVETAQAILDALRAFSRDSHGLTLNDVFPARRTA